jgi:probable phosphoglycerate mutase
MCTRCLARWYVLALASRATSLTWPRHVRYRFPYRAYRPYQAHHVPRAHQAWRPMRSPSQNPSTNAADAAVGNASAPANPPSASSPDAVAPEAETQGTLHPAAQTTPRPPRLVLLVRHGQTTYNVEGRLPGQLDGVALTDEGRCQAWRAAVALSALPLSAVISSPLERALETAKIIARGFALDVRQDARLMDTDVGLWAGQKIKDLEQNDPAWKDFVEHPTEPPEGVESLATVQERAVAACEAARRDESLGNYIVLVAHADVVKLILAYYSRMHLDSVRFVFIDNAAISALAFAGDDQPHVPPRILAINWTPLPRWLAPPPWRPTATPAAADGHAEAITTAPASARDEKDTKDESPLPVVSASTQAGENDGEGEKDDAKEQGR